MIQVMKTGNSIQNIELAGISLILSGSCLNQNDISFDNLERPMVGKINDDESSYVNVELIRTICTITLSDGTRSSIIDIHPETGYQRIRISN